MPTSVNGPDFICIGMPKAGTGWLYDQLSHHPDFWMPPGKELHYLSRDFPKLKIFRRYLEDWDRTVRYGRRMGLTWGERELTFLRDIVSCAGKPMDFDRYAGLFRHKGTLLSGDISPGYGAIEDEFIGTIAASLPETKIILLVREPVSRAWSRLCHAERVGQFDVSLLDNPAKFADFISRSHLTGAFFASTIIRQWSRYYPSDRQFRVVLFDDIVERPSETLRGILEFIGADSSKAGTLPADYNSKSSFKKLEMPEPIRKILAEYFEEEVRVYSALVGGATRDAWPSLMVSRAANPVSIRRAPPNKSRIKPALDAQLSRVGRHGRATKRRKSQAITVSRRPVRAVARRAAARIPVIDLLIDAHSFVVNVLIRDCSVFLKRILRLPQRH